MSYLTETVPADSEAVTLGASRIRELKVDLDALIEQIWEDAGLFTPGWIKAGGAAGGASLFTAGAIQTADIAPFGITTGLLAPQAVTPAQIQLLSITAGLLASGIVMPANSVATNSIQNNAVGLAQSNISSLVAGFAKVGTYNGTAASVDTITVSGLSFAPTVLIVVDSTHTGIGIAFNSEASGGISSIHESWDSPVTGLISPFLNDVQWNADGFTILHGNTFFSTNLRAYTYLALAI